MVNSTVAAILVNYNSAADTLECIASLYVTGYNGLRIVVVDNASRNEEAAMIAESYPAVHVIPLAVNLGFAAGNNVGIKWAIDNGADYIMLINNDTIIDPDAIAQLVHGLREHPGYAVLSGKILYHTPPDRIWYAGGSISVWLAKCIHFRQGEKDDDCGGPSVMPTQFVSGCWFIASTATWRTVGLLDEEFFFGVEDMEFSMRLRRLNLKLGYVPTARMWHKVGRSRKGISAPYVYQNFFGRTIFMRKVLGKGVLWSVWVWTMASLYQGLWLMRRKPEFATAIRKAQLTATTVQ